MFSLLNKILCSYHRSLVCDTCLIVTFIYSLIMKRFY
nr:MAG TPA: hypothetical protein [Caudoviricetes sp.]